MRVHTRAVRITLAALLVSLLTAAPAGATYFGFNGKISFNRFFELGNDEFKAELFSVNPDGSNVFQVTNFGTFAFSEFSDHSPDGRTLAFQRFDFPGEGVPEPALQIWLTDADGTNPRQLTDFAETDGYEGAFDPAFSPDGRTLAIDSVADGVPGIFLIPARAPAGELLTEADAVRVTSAPEDTAFDSEPQFSPDGRWIVFTRFSIECFGEDPELCQTRIYKVRTNGTGLRLLAGPELNASAPDWHPSGLAIAVDTHDSFFAPGVGHIMVMLADGSHKRVIVRGDADSHYGNPSFSPDGTRIAYTHWSLGAPDEPVDGNIWTAWVTGHHPRQVTDSGRDNKADWGPRPRHR